MTMSVCMFTYERTYIHIHTYVRILIYVCMFTCVNTCLHRLAYVRISMYIISTCTLAYMDAYTDTRLQSLRIRTHVRTNTHIHANAQKICCYHARVPMCSHSTDVHMYVDINACAQKRTIRIYSYICLIVYTHECPFTRVIAHTLTYKHTCTYTHTGMFTYALTCTYKVTNVHSYTPAHTSICHYACEKIANFVFLILTNEMPVV